MPTRLTDRAPLNGTRKTGDGYLVAEAFVARTGIQLYGGYELGDEREVVRVYRAEDEVKAPASVRTYSHAPITMGHPDVLVDSTNHSTLAKGEVSTEAEWVDGKLRLPLIVKDEAAIRAVEDGSARELSAGYLADLDWTPGVTPDGEAYDARQTNIRINHVALVPKGRAGIARIGDEAGSWGAAPLTDADGVTHPSKKDDTMSDKLTTVVLGDAAVQVAPEDAAKIDAFKREKEKAVADAQAAHDKALGAKDAEIAKLTKERDDAKAEIVTGDALDALVAKRAAVTDAAKRVAPNLDPKGLTDAALRRAAVTAAKGEDAVKDRSDDYVEALFDGLAAAAKPDPVRDGFSKPGAVPAKDNGQSDYEKRLNDAWKQPVIVEAK